MKDVLKFGSLYKNKYHVYALYPDCIYLVNTEWTRMVGEFEHQI